MCLGGTLFLSCIYRELCIIHLYCVCLVLFACYVAWPDAVVC